MKEVRIRKRSREQGPTALERLKNITDEVAGYAEERINAGLKMGADIGAPAKLMEEVRQLTEKEDYWSALEKGVRTIKLTEKAIDDFRMVYEEVELVAIRIKEAEMLGADVSTAKRFMEQAREAANSSSAMYFLGLAKKDAEIKIEQFTEVRDRVRKILDALKELKQKGCDTSGVEKTFEKARLATQYEAAIHYLSQCEEYIGRLKNN